MRPRGSSRSSRVAALALAVLIAGCAAQTPRPSVEATASIAQTYPMPGGGTVQVTVERRYPAGQAVVVQLVVTAGTAAIRGPIGGRVLSSGIEGEKVIRLLAPADLDGGRTVEPGVRAATMVRWDARTDTGDVAPRDTYTLVLDFVVGTDPVRVGTTIELVAP